MVQAEDGATETREDEVEDVVAVEVVVAAATVEEVVEDRETPAVEHLEDHNEEEEEEVDIVKPPLLSCPNLPTSRQKHN